MPPPSPPLCRRVKGVTWATSACSLSSPFAGPPLPRVPAGPHRAGEAHPQQVLLVELPPVAHPGPISESTGVETLTTQHPLGLTVGTPREKALGPALKACVNQVQLVERDGVAERAAFHVTLAAALCPP